MIRSRNLVLAASSLIALASIATAQNASSPAAKPAAKQWVAPGTPGSEIDGTVFHAQVLLSTAGFSTSVIDGKDGMVFKKAVRGFQQSRGLPVSGKLDGPTRAALLQGARPSTVTVRLTRDDISHDYVYPFPKEPEDQARLKRMSYRNMIEEVAERYHTTPRTLIALNGPTTLIGIGQTLRLPNVIPTARNYSSVTGDHAAIFAKLNVDSNQPAGDHIVVDKSEGVLKVLDKADRLVAQFPVTMGSTKDPLPLGTWKATTYAFLPPFHYQPSLFWDAKDKGAPEEMLPPGPNGPVGVAWLDLTKEHYGIHGTPEPSTIGRAESHGCIRMTNWDVLRLSQILKPGFTAVFQA